MSTTVYYPRAKSINFYNIHGVVSGGIIGSMAFDKFWRMMKQGEFPRISLRKKVRTTI